MKTLKYICSLLLVALSVAACQKDEDKLYVSSIKGETVTATADNIVLSKDNKNDEVLTLSWTKEQLTTSNPDLKPTDLMIQKLQVSTQDDFSGSMLETVMTTLTKTYTGADLNNLAKNIGATPDVENSLYFRLASQTGQNMSPVYSNVITVKVTPFTVDMGIGFILDKNMEDTGLTLASPQWDGIYSGFVGATSWMNFYLREGDDTTWGNDGVSGTAFVMSSSDEVDARWNFWYPGLGGCYYTVVNTPAAEWTALYIPTLTVSGDLTGEMTFDRPTVKWNYIFTAEKAGDITVRIAGNGKLYNVSTGTDDAAAIDTPVAFGQNGDKLTFAQGTSATATDIKVSVPAAGEYTLVLNLFNPEVWTAEVVAGGEAPVQIPSALYLPGVDDITTGEWNFNNRLLLYQEEKQQYSGVADVNSEWGYKIAVEKGNWDDYYGAVGDTENPADPMIGTLAWAGGNLPAPEAGLYFIDVCITDLTYRLTPVTEVYCTGFNDNWDLMAMTATETPGVYTATITATQSTPWGFQILLDQDWTTKLGVGAEGQLLKMTDGGSAQNIPFDKTEGTYTLTVDLVHASYTIE